MPSSSAAWLYDRPRGVAFRRSSLARHTKQCDMSVLRDWSHEKIQAACAEILP
jgi:hypothetical protein